MSLYFTSSGQSKKIKSLWYGDGTTNYRIKKLVSNAGVIHSESVTLNKYLIASAAVGLCTASGSITGIPYGQTRPVIIHGASGNIFDASNDLRSAPESLETANYASITKGTLFNMTDAYSSLTPKGYAYAWTGYNTTWIGTAINCEKLDLSQLRDYAALPAYRTFAGQATEGYSDGDIEVAYDGTNFTAYVYTEE